MSYSQRYSKLSFNLILEIKNDEIEPTILYPLARYDISTSKGLSL